MTDPNEQVLWRGTSSQALHLGEYLGCLVATAALIAMSAAAAAAHWKARPGSGMSLAAAAPLALLAPILGYAGLLWWRNRSRVYELSSERLRMTQGILNKRTDDLELYRVRDSALLEPLVQRLFGLGTIVLQTSDRSHPAVSIEAVADSKRIFDELRRAVEAVRQKKGARDIDVS